MITAKKYYLASDSALWPSEKESGEFRSSLLDLIRSGFSEEEKKQEELNDAYECGDLYAIIDLTNNNGDNITAESRLLRAIELGNLVIVKYLILSDKVVPDYKHALHAVLNNQYKILTYLLCQRDSDNQLIIDSTINHSLLLRLAARDGLFDILTLLSVNDNADAAAIDNQAIKSAVSNRHFDVVRYLATLPNVDPNEALSCCDFYDEDLHIFKFLISHDKIDLPTLIDHYHLNRLHKWSDDCLSLLDNEIKRRQNNA